MTIKSTVIAPTSKGHRVWLQGVAEYGFVVGAAYDTTYTPTAIVYTLNAAGKRKVAKGKGGIIDTVGKKVSTWAQGASDAVVVIDRERGRIIVEKGEVRG